MTPSPGPPGPSKAPTPARTPGVDVPATAPVSRVGVALMLGLLALVLLAGTARNGLAQALGDLGFRNPAIGVYTLLLLSPIVLEGLYPRLRRTTNLRWRAVLENLHRNAPYLILIGTTMLVMRIENVYDLDIARALGLDWTPLVHRVEGDLVARLQAPMRSFLFDHAMRFVYVVMYALFHVVAMVWFAATGRDAMVRRFTATWVLVYLVALPFYILAPVNETWTTNPAYGCYDSYGSRYGDFSTPTAGVLHDDCGDAGGIVMAISSINNCFPSLHNAFAWALPFLLWRSGWRRGALAVGVVSALVSVSTIELGIHWVTDLVAGIALAWVVTWLAVRLDYRLDHRMRLVGARRVAPSSVPYDATGAGPPPGAAP